MPATPPELSERAARLAKRRARRVAKAERREKMLELVISGFDRVQIASRFGLSLATVRREVDRAIDSRRLDAPNRYVQLQVERLHKALKVVDLFIEDGNLAAVDPLLKLVEKLDRYHGVARPAYPPEAAPRLEARSAPLALTHLGVAEKDA